MGRRDVRLPDDRQLNEGVDCRLQQQRVRHHVVCVFFAGGHKLLLKPNKPPAHSQAVENTHAQNEERGWLFTSRSVEARHTVSLT